MTQKWKVWEEDNEYGELLYKRATGELPEMESSKKIARVIKELDLPNIRILDVGCGAGHYLRSLRRELGDTFEYVGCDATAQYIERAKKAFASDTKASFQQADIFNLDFADNSFDLVICNNVLLHLPSVAKPISELIRVAKSKVIIRMLCGDRSFRIMNVIDQPDGKEFSVDAEPTEFYFYNIYSSAYIEYLLENNAKANKWTIDADTDFDKKRIEESAKEHTNIDASRILGDYQVNGYILQPWAIIKIDL